MRVILSVFFSLCCISAFSQITSQQDGDWGDPDTWDCDCVPTSEDAGPIIVENNVVIDADIFLNEVVIANGGIVTINSGVTVTIKEDFTAIPLLVEAGGQLINNGTIDLISWAFTQGIIVDGILENSSTIDLADPSLLIFNSGSTYRHAFASGGDIPLANWDANSTCEITGLSGAAPAVPGNLNQTFGNFTWNTTSLATGPTFHLGAQLTTVNGDLRLLSTGGGQVRFSGNGGSGFALTIGGDLIVEGGMFFFVHSATSDAEVVVAGDFLQTRGTLGLSLTNSNAFTLQVGGNFEKTSGTLTAGSGTGAKNIVFAGNRTPQTYSVNTMPSSAQLNFRVASGAVLSLGESTALVTSGTAGSFTLSTGGTVQVASLSASGAIQGNIPQATKTFESGSTIIYNGTGPQFMSITIPTQVNTIIDNASGVSLAGNSTVGGNLTLANGNLSVGA